MIKKSVLVALALLGLYHFLLPHLSHRFYQINGQQRANYSRLQRYLYDVPDNTNVIVGSSLANMLSDEILGPEYFKLTLPGGSLFTGLEAISRAGKRPTVVLIETNVVLKDPDRELLADLFSPLLNPLRRYSNVFREAGRPSNFVAGIAEACVRRSAQLGSLLLGRKAGVTESSESDKPLDPQVRSRIMLLEEKLSNHAPATEELANKVNKLAQYVDAITQAGSFCIFIEMPIDNTLAKLPLESAVRKALLERFPPTRYHWISFPSNHNYETSDSLHLTPTETRALTRLLVTQVKTLKNKQTESDKTIVQRGK